MTTIDSLKALETPGTPLFVCDCILPSGDVQRWSTHKVVYLGNTYAARIVQHTLFDLRSSSDEATDGISKIALTLANADAELSGIERNVGWKGSQLTVQFLFFDLTAGTPLSEATVAFRGTANAPDESTESTLKLSFTSRLTLQRIYLPETRVQKRCPWTFPASADQRAEAVSGGSKGRWSAFYHCGYSADQTGGAGNLNSGAAYTSCDFSRAQCIQRGMFSADSGGHVTKRFGGIEFIPPSIVIRSYGEKGSHLTVAVENQAQYNDFVPLIYGMGRYRAPVIFARNDGNLTHMEVLLGAGEISEVIQVLVSDIEIPLAVPGTNMTATGWYTLVTPGRRSGNFNTDFVDGSGNPLGDPYGSLAVLSVVVPNAISNGQTLPSVNVLVQGLSLDSYDSTGAYITSSFSNNSAWVLLDALLRSGWSRNQINLASFAAAAQVCAVLIPTTDLNGNATTVPRYQCNLILDSRRSAGDVVRGIRNSSLLYLIFNDSGLLELRVEDTLANQQPTESTGSNAQAQLDGGWPAYEFGDNEVSGILRTAKGMPSFRVYSRGSSDTPNQYTVEFQDQFNDFQQDSLALVNADDELITGQEITAGLPALGLPNFNQATRAMSLMLSKSIYGNTYVDFETSVRGVGLKPGDLITLTYAHEGFERQPFRISKLSPGANFRTVKISAQIHNDSWYVDGSNAGSGQGKQPGSNVGIPRPLVGTVLDTNGIEQFGVVETAETAADGTESVYLQVSFSVPNVPGLGQSQTPLLGLNALIDQSGGTLAGGQTLYYAVTELNPGGSESPLSFVVRATVPGTTNTNAVELQNLSFTASGEAFNVYRGANPSQLLRIAANQSIALTYTDAGAVSQLTGPPDFNFDHANFYWRSELQPEESATVFSPTSIGNATLNMPVNAYVGKIVRITTGLGGKQERVILSNTATTVTATAAWSIAPDSTSKFLIADASWQLGASSSSSPVTFSVPNQEGLTIQISGRAANVLDQECSVELSPLTPWTIGGSVGIGGDSDVPGIPTLGLNVAGQGTVDITGVGFTSLLNTNSISAGTLTLAFWDESNSPGATALDTAVAAIDTNVALDTAELQPGDLVQIEIELISVTGTNTDGSYAVNRGVYGTTAAAHAALTPYYLLNKNTYVMPFAVGFFGSLASGTYVYPLTLPDVRIAAADFFVTNTRGNSAVQRQGYTANTDAGLRTLSGGQISIQIDGMLAVQTGAVPPLLMDETQSVRDVYAVVQQAPSFQSITMQITQDGQPYCQLTIPVNETISNVVDGFALGPLQAQAQIGLDILSVSSTAGTLPGADLTVTIRL
jgi:Putative phage tail protein